MTVDPNQMANDVLATVVTAKGPIGSLGGAWMTSSAEEEATTAAGLRDWQLYFLARHGVMGDVDADVITSVAYVFPPDYLRREWEVARAKLPPAEAVKIYLELCHGWGRASLDGFDGARRLSELSRTIVSSVAVFGLPLFAGWRALDVPTDAPAECAHLMQLLREHRGACHGLAVVASGMPPLTAILTSPGGETNAVEYGWEPPFPEVTDDDCKLRKDIETLTDKLVAPAYAALGPAGRRELLGLLGAAYRHCFEK